MRGAPGGAASGDQPPGTGSTGMVRLAAPGTSGETRITIQPPGNPTSCVGKPIIPQVSTMELIDINIRVGYQPLCIKYLNRQAQ